MQQNCHVLKEKNNTEVTGANGQMGDSARRRTKVCRYVFKVSNFRLESNKEFLPRISTNVFSYDFFFVFFGHVFPRISTNWAERLEIVENHLFDSQRVEQFANADGMRNPIPSIEHLRLLVLIWICKLSVSQMPVFFLNIFDDLRRCTSLRGPIRLNSTRSTS